MIKGSRPESALLSSDILDFVEKRLHKILRPATGFICNILLNVLMFMPYGYLMPALFPKRSFCWQKVLLIGIIITLFIEMMQLVTHRGCFDLDDIFHNTLGVLLGYALGHYAIRGKY